MLWSMQRRDRMYHRRSRRRYENQYACAATRLPHAQPSPLCHTFDCCDRSCPRATPKHVNHETGSPKALTTVHASLQLPGVRDDRALRGAPAPRAGLLHSVDDGLAGRDAAEDHVLSWLGLGIRLGLELGLGLG